MESEAPGSEKCINFYVGDSPSEDDNVSVNEEAAGTSTSFFRTLKAGEHEKNVDFDVGNSSADDPVANLAAAGTSYSTQIHQHEFDESDEDPEQEQQKMAVSNSSQPDDGTSDATTVSLGGQELS
ncbi:hypothetical protein Hamer_G006956 [Homarus americanus]|uniref:Uncharacterized protein n=1 Tax=Homarus americanus TaxID=6706 RepID=A0A8J5TIH2_HOMAM|nr:hypothetical protein Hamer_G006956 [Homarus americanus]